MRLLSRLFAAASQTSRLLRTFPATPPHHRPFHRFPSPSASRPFHTSMPVFANILSQNAIAVETHGNFDLVKRFKLDFADIHVSKWRSRISGLSVVHLDYDGAFLPSHRAWIPMERIHPTAPLVNGYFVVGTESTYASLPSIKRIHAYKIPKYSMIAAVHTP